eukprot:CAMPEP_0202039320 /NCGR_PEP_ID=MMETSP0962-20130828/15606_1 /ASSEMBLY_ACC=CAM_ASM_000488 /TAXON_ID=4773 /ORGANISM="Schizochytrium aggregatum, Strain ATCC28209" /LENGTH=136 /DNA_ID=CAMNT_0048603529 /DNA_START=32 /DNA_END=442 /DNA_ORIENTATION=+
MCHVHGVPSGWWSDDDERVGGGLAQLVELRAPWSLKSSDGAQKSWPGKKDPPASRTCEELRRVCRWSAVRFAHSARRRRRRPRRCARSAPVDGFTCAATPARFKSCRPAPLPTIIVGIDAPSLAISSSAGSPPLSM